MKRFYLMIILLGVTASIRSEEVLKTALQAGWQESKVCELLFEDSKIRTIRCTFPPGVGHEKHYHPPHFGYTLKGGTMRITDSSGERVIGSAESSDSTWQSKGVAWHKVLNIGTTTAQYLIVEQKY
jgi:quercetin dioxygenase-like cupin family protein